MPNLGEISGALTDLFKMKIVLWFRSIHPLHVVLGFKMFIILPNYAPSLIPFFPPVRGEYGIIIIIVVPGVVLRVRRFQPTTRWCTTSTAGVLVVWNW